MNLGRFLRASARAVLDLLGIISLLPMFSIRWTASRITAVVMLYFLKDLRYEHLITVRDRINVMVAEIREEGFDGLKAHVLSAFTRIGEFFQNLYSRSLSLLGYGSSSDIVRPKALTTAHAEGGA